MATDLASHKLRQTINAGNILVTHTDPDFTVEFARGTLYYRVGDISAAIPKSGSRIIFLDTDGLAFKLPMAASMIEPVRQVLERIQLVISFIRREPVFTGEWAFLMDD
jgi:hypothetical protein